MEQDEKFLVILIKSALLLYCRETRFERSCFVVLVAVQRTVDMVGPVEVIAPPPPMKVGVFQNASSKLHFEALKLF